MIGSSLEGLVIILNIVIFWRCRLHQAKGRTVSPEDVLVDDGGLD